MIDDRLTWFACYPSKWLDALAALKPDQGLIYSIILLRIYDKRGPISDTVESIARRTGYRPAHTAKVIEQLCDLGKLSRLPDGSLTNQFAEQEISRGEKISNATRKNKSRAGKISAEKRKQNQSSEPTAVQQKATHLQEHKQVQDSMFSKENIPETLSKPIKVRPDKPEPVLDDGWPSDFLEQFWKAFPAFRREGKRKVGEKLARLRRDKVVDWLSLIGAVRRYAGTNPGQYACAPIVWLNGEKWDREYGGNGNAANRNDVENLGFAGIAARFRSGATPDARRPAPENLEPINGH